MPVSNPPRIPTFQQVAAAPAYTGAAGGLAKVNATETGLEYGYPSLTDCGLPNYSASAGKYLKVSAGGAGLEYGTPSGGGGGETLTEVVVPSPTNGQTVTVTHPSVPTSGTGSGNIRFSGLAYVPGEVQSEPPIGYWENEDLNVNGASWVQDSGTAGHFSVDPGPRVVARATLNIVGGNYPTIASFADADHTVASSVVLSESTATGAITDIIGTYGHGDQVSSPVYSDYTGLAMPYSTHLLMSKTTFDALGTFTRVSGGRYESSICRTALSVDGGTTWLAYDSTDWVPISLANIRTDGMNVGIYGDGKAFFDSRGSGAEEIQAAGWTALYDLGVAAGDDFEMRIAVGLDGAGVQWGASLMSIRWSGVAPGYVQPMGLSNETGFSKIQRKSETTTDFTITINGYSGTPVGWHCQVWTSYSG